MGISSSKSKNTPIYKKEVEGAYGDLSGTFRSTMPKVQANADMVSGLLPGAIEKYQAGNSAVNAASSYVTDTLGGDATNPFLEQWISQAQEDTTNQMGARLNKLGLGPAGSTYQGTVGREVGKVGLGMRYNDWLGGQDRKARAAGMAPGLAAAETIQMAPIMAFSEAARAPMDLASQYGAGVGGLLGQYQKTKTTTPWGLALMGGAENLAKAYAGGG